MHGIVYVPESEAPSDPLEKESTFAHIHILEGGSIPRRNGTRRRQDLRRGSFTMACADVR